MKEQFYDLSFETLADGTIRMKQHDYCGEAVIVDAHPQQLLHVARTLSADGVMPERIATLERRLLWLHGRFEETRAALPHDLYERCASAFEFDAWLQASIDVATEFCADLVNVVEPIEYQQPQGTQDLQGATISALAESRCQLGLEGL